MPRAPQDGPHECGVDGDHQEADQPNAAHRGGCERRRLIPLRAAEQRPRSAEAVPRPQTLGEHPGRREDGDRGEHPLDRRLTGEQSMRRPSPWKPQRADDDREHGQQRPRTWKQPVLVRQQETGHTEPGPSAALHCGRCRADDEQQRNQPDPRQPPPRWGGKGQSRQGAGDQRRRGPANQLSWLRPWQCLRSPDPTWR